MPNYEYSGGKVFSPKLLLADIDKEISLFLQKKEMSADTEPFDPVNVRILREIVTARGSYAKLLATQIPDIDWRSEEPLSAKDFDKLCDRISAFADLYCNEDWSRLSAEAQRKQTTPCAVAGQEMFLDERITQAHMSILWGFGIWLRKNNLHEIKTKDESEWPERREVLNTVSAAIEIVVMCIGTDQGQSVVGTQLLHSLIRLRSAGVSLAKIKEWEEQSEARFEALGVINLASIQEAEEMMKEVFQSHFPNLWVDDVTQELYKVVKIGPEGDCKLQLLPAGHFTVLPTIGECPEQDCLPDEGNLHHGLHEFHNASLFNSLGEKVFWGDLTNEEVSQIRGPYYVLSQGASYHDVPRWAKVSESAMPAQDSNRPKGMPDKYFPPDQRLLKLAYIKAVAMGKIENGMYTKNPTEIAWPQE